MNVMQTTGCQKPVVGVDKSVKVAPRDAAVVGYFSCLPATYHSAAAYLVPDNANNVLAQAQSVNTHAHTQIINVPGQGRVTLIIQYEVKSEVR